MIITPDANILVYATLPVTDPKRDRSLDIMGRCIVSEHCCLVLQALGEFAHVTLRKLRLPPEDVYAMIETWQLVMPVHAAAAEDLPIALEAVRDHKLQFWDAMLWASARRVGVRYLVSEDLQDGRTLGGVTFVNPFNPGNNALIDRILPA